MPEPDDRNVLRPPESPFHPHDTDDDMKDADGDDERQGDQEQEGAAGPEPPTEPPPR